MRTLVLLTALLGLVALLPPCVTAVDAQSLLRHEPSPHVQAMRENRNVKFHHYYSDTHNLTCDHEAITQNKTNCSLPKSGHTMLIVLQKTNMDDAAPFLKKHKEKFPKTNLIYIENDCDHSNATHCAKNYNVSWALKSAGPKLRLSCTGYQSGCHLCASICNIAKSLNITCRRIFCWEPTWHFRENNHRTNEGLRFLPHTDEHKYYLNRHHAKYVVTCTGNYGYQNYVQYPIGHEFIIFVDWVPETIINVMLDIIDNPITIVRVQVNETWFVSHFHYGMMSKSHSNTNILKSTEPVQYIAKKNHCPEIIHAFNGSTSNPKMQEVIFGKDHISLRLAPCNPRQAATEWVYNWPHGEIKKRHLYDSNLRKGLVVHEFAHGRRDCWLFNCYRYDFEFYRSNQIQDYRAKLETHYNFRPHGDCLPHLGMFPIMESSELMITFNSTVNLTDALKSVEENYNLQVVEVEGTVVANNWRKCNATAINVHVGRPNYEHKSMMLRLRKSGAIYSVKLYGQLIRHDITLAYLNSTLPLFETPPPGAE